MFGDLHGQRLRKLKAEAGKIELESAILRGEFISRVELEKVFGEVAGGILQVIKASSLTTEQQNDFAGRFHRSKFGLRTLLLISETVAAMATAFL